MKRVHLKYVKYLVLILYISYYGSILFYSHLHIDEQGIYVHSHPFKNSPDNEPHSHNSALELQFIYNLTSFLTNGEINGVFSIHRFIPPVLNTITTNYSTENTTSYLTHYSLRAPPAIL